MFLITKIRVAQSVRCLATGWKTERSRFDPRQRQRVFFPLASVSRSALGPTQPPVQWASGVLSPAVKRGRGVTLTTHPHLVPRSRMSRSYTSSPPERLHGVLWDSFYLECLWTISLQNAMYQSPNSSLVIIFLPLKTSYEPVTTSIHSIPGQYLIFPLDN
jgi:hypothetical protein